MPDAVKLSMTLLMTDSVICATSTGSTWLAASDFSNAVLTASWTIGCARAFEVARVLRGRLSSVPFDTLVLPACACRMLCDSVASQRGNDVFSGESGRRLLSAAMSLACAGVTVARVAMADRTLVRKEGCDIRAIVQTGLRGWHDTARS